MNKLTFFIFSVIIVIFGWIFYTFQIADNKPQSGPAVSQYDVQPTTQSFDKAQDQQITSAPVPTLTDEQKKATMTATIKTSKGDIVMELYPQEAPLTVANFVNKAKTGFYKGLLFHRVEDWVLQGGDPIGNGTGGGSMPVEFNNKPFVVGAVGIASRGDGKTQNDAQFFIVKTDAQFLNGQYTNFGLVTEGMDVVNKMVIGDKILEIIIQ